MRHLGSRHLLLLSVGLTLAFFLPGIPGAGWILDDMVALARHQHHGDLLGEWLRPTYSHAGGGEGHIWRPVAASIQHVAAMALGREPWVFRSLNLGVHLLNLWLLAWVARRAGAPVAVAALAALAFAAHPVAPEVVCWASDFHDLAATAFLLLAAGLALGPRPAGGVPGRSTPAAGASPTAGGASGPGAVTSAGGAGGLGAWRAPAAGLSLLLACLCKESSVAFVPVALAAPLLLGRGWRAGLAFAVAAALAAGSFLLLHGAVVGEGYGGAAGGIGLGRQLESWLTLSGWLVHVPHVAPMAHLAGSAGSLPVLVGAATTGLGLGLAALLVTTGRGMEGRSLGLGLVTWAVMLVPAGLAVALIGVAGLRYVYTPLALALSLGAGALAGIGGARRPRALALAVLLTWTVIGVVRIPPRVAAWQSEPSLWGAELEREPGNPYAQARLARSLVKSDPAAAMALWSAALESPPARLKVLDWQKERYDLARLAFTRGRPDLTLAHLEIMMAELEASGRRAPRNAHCVRADALEALGRPEEAEASARRCDDGGG